MGRRLTDKAKLMHSISILGHRLLVHMKISPKVDDGYFSTC